MSVVCQRWRERKARYRHLGDHFDPRRFAVTPLDEASARAFVVRHHYSGSYPAARYRVGLYHRGAFQAERLVGVAVFSVPMNQRVVPLYTDCSPQAGAELGRFVLLDECPGNSETWFLARAFRLLRQGRPEIAAVVSYCDPVPRRAVDGALVMPGHIGTIYQAAGARYHGRAKARRLIVDAHGHVVSARMLSKIRNEESGQAYALRALVAAGAPARHAGEAPRDYVERALRSGAFRAVRHPGNHVYSWRLDRRGPRPAQAYPRGIDPVAELPC